MLLFHVGCEAKQCINITELMLMKHSYTTFLTRGSIMVIASVRAGADASVNACLIVQSRSENRFSHTRAYSINFCREGHWEALRMQAVKKPIIQESSP